ncbi:MAG: DMT family transporter, partial [Proteobacteria bacterium]|nr:DMT family transporter [Pseudomonadota bacterium]
MNKKLAGLYFSLSAMVFWGASVVASRYAVVNLQMHPYVHSTVRLFVTSVVLLLIAGKGAKVEDSLKNPSTWLYSSLQILLNMGVATALIYITSTHATLLQRVNIILGLLIGGIFLNKKVSKNDKFGGLIIFLGISLLLSTLEFKQAISGMAAVLFAALCHTLRTIIAEKHPVAKDADTFSDYCRVLAYILLATSLTFLLLGLIIGFINHFDSTLEVFNFLPAIENMLTKDQLMFATCSGAFILAPAMYCFFYGAQKAGTTNFLIYTAYTPVVTWILEYTADFFGIMQAPIITYKEVLSALFIMGGALYITYFRNNKKKKSQKLAPKARQDLDVLRDTIKTAYICFDDDSKKVS